MNQTRTIRGFQFNRPQRIAALLLALLLAQGLWAGVLPLFGQAGAPELPSLWALLAQVAQLFAAVVLGGAVWWVTRRQFGNQGGYTALAFYCFSPAVARADRQMVAALAIYGVVYTCMGVAHALQGPRRKWRPRIVLLTGLMTLAAVAQWTALGASAVLGLALMLWIAEDRRRLVLPIVLIALATASLLAWAAGGFRLLWQTAVAGSGTPLPSRLFSLEHLALATAMALALGLYLASRRSRFLGNTAPLLAALVLLGLAWKGVAGAELWALPFGLTFLAGVSADAYETRWGVFARGLAIALILVQVAVCLWFLVR